MTTFISATAMNDMWAKHVAQAMKPETDPEKFGRVWLLKQWDMFEKNLAEAGVMLDPADESPDEQIRKWMAEYRKRPARA